MVLLALLALALAGLGCRGGETLDAGLVVAPEARAAEVGARVLGAGGNAVDAAVATHFALAVTFPYAGNIGGGGFLLVHEPRGQVTALDFRETAPARATRDMFLDARGEVAPQASLNSHLAAGVPGSVRGMWDLHRRYGSLPWRELLEPAIALADDGFPLDEWTAGSFAAAAERFRGLPPEFARRVNFEHYFRGRAGERLVQRELAATLRRIAEAGADGFYRGETAQLVAREMTRGGGLVTGADLDAYRTAWREPVAGTYRGHRVVSMPPPSSGGPLLIELLNMLEPFSPPPAHGSADQVHLYAELEKRAFADRAEHLGDPRFHRVPLDMLLDKDYALERAAEVQLDGCSDPREIRPGKVERESTLHFSIVDRHRMVVACTTTINDGYGSGIVVEGAGFLLNNEMDDFSARPGARNLYGVVGGEANAIAPGKRMLSTMAPTFVFDAEGRLWLALGSPGGSTILTTIFQVIANRIDYGMTLRQAVAAPRVHHQWPPAQPGSQPLTVERGQRAPADATVARLRAMGYSIEPRKSIGDVQALEIAGSRVLGAPDPRGTGRAVPERR